MIRKRGSSGGRSGGISENELFKSVEEWIVSRGLRVSGVSTVMVIGRAKADWSDSKSRKAARKEEETAIPDAGIA